MPRCLSCEDSKTGNTVLLPCLSSKKGEEEEGKLNEQAKIMAELWVLCLPG